jgi:ferric-dicitrate binding protein FerR (iron transport regulator)
MRQSGTCQRIPPRFVVAAWCALSTLALPVPACAQTAGKVTRVAGPGSVVKAAPQGSQTASATAGSPIHWGETLQTGDGGRIRAQLEDGSILSLGQETSLLFHKHDDKAQQTILELTHGALRVNLQRLTAPESFFEIRTNHCVLRALGGDIAVNAINPAATVVTAKSGQTVLNCANPEDPKKLTIPAADFAMLGEDSVHPMRAAVVGSRSKQFSITPAVDQTPSAGNPRGDRGLVADFGGRRAE